VESTRHPHRALQILGTMPNANDPSRGIVRGVALNPGTPIEAVDPLLGELELILVLAVNPGWSGQKFIPTTFQRVVRLKQRVGQNVLICVDGGITRDNVEEVGRLGVDLIVTGSAVFDGKASLANVRQMMSAIQ
jgi:ribulose-phosphate 3-epimerase